MVDRGRHVDTQQGIVHISWEVSEVSRTSGFQAFTESIVMHVQLNVAYHTVREHSKACNSALKPHGTIRISNRILHMNTWYLLQI